MIKDLIFDVGMYDGSDTEYYLKEGFRVVSIEADPTLVAKATKKFNKYIKEGKLKIINVGISAEEGVADFFVNEVNPFWNSFDEKISSRENLPYHKISITCNKFSNILKEFGVPYYLKIDIEGCDHLCLEALPSGDLPQYVSFEADNEGNLDMLETVYEKGYRKFKCINQNTFLPLAGTYEMVYDTSTMSTRDKLYLKLHQAEKLPVKVLRKIIGREILKSLLNPSKHLSFFKGSSGPFGKDLPGEWLSIEKIKDIYHRSYKDYLSKCTNNYSFWCDFHATL